jgi:hypothetical protein
VPAVSFPTLCGEHLPRLGQRLSYFTVTAARGQMTAHSGGSHRQPACLGVPRPARVRGSHRFDRLGFGAAPSTVARNRYAATCGRRAV